MFEFKDKHEGQDLRDRGREETENVEKQFKEH